MRIIRAIRRSWIVPLLLGTLIAATAGCGRTVRNAVPSRVANSNEWIEPNPYANSRPLAPYVAQRMPEIPTGEAPRNVLVLSGGGMYGAFSVGVLNGWSKSPGCRPTFDVVTGVSTGALIATFAFLGPQYDAEVKRLFTTTTDRDIYRRRGPLAPLRADSVASNEPLKNLIAVHLTADVIASVAEAHAGGRRLYVSTTNLDTRRQVVWDMGAIASRGELQLYRDVILASASIPGFFPPVPIDVEVNGQRYTELHTDGGATAQLFVQRSMIGPPSAEVRQSKACGPTTVWAISAGKLRADASCTGARTLEIGMNAINAMIYAQTRNDIRRIAAMTHEAKAEFRLMALPDDFPVESTRNLFDPEVMSKLFDVGEMLGKSGPKGWRRDAPDPDEAESGQPRTGTQFFSPEPFSNRSK